MNRGLAIGSILGVVGLLLLPGVTRARVDGEALVGRPFGVGRVTIPAADAGAGLGQVLIQEKGGRVFYPVTSSGVLGRLIGQFLGGSGSQPATGATVHFLFRGTEPLQITVFTPQAQTITLQPQTGNQRQFDRQLEGWWREYSAAIRKQQEASDHPPLVNDYLQSMLSQRLGLSAPLIERLTKNDQPTVQTVRSLELLTGVERLRSETLRGTMLGRGDFGQPADQPLPEGITWSAPAVPANLPAVEIEELARQVPAECFYVRFGKFANYLWMNKLLEEHGGDIGSMVTLRSYAAPLNKRTQQQLALEQNVLADLLGPQVVADVAIIGRDTFGKEGAALGILFEAKNEVLGLDIAGQRKKALAREKANGAKEEKLQLAGREVSFISTPDNRLRSFHAFAEPYHLVTTSRAIAERFLEVQGGAGSLGESAEFRFARQVMPVTRDDTIFVYFSSAFFAGLMSPQYQIELERRMKSVTDMELLMLARLAAAGEGVRGETFEDLSEAGLLPRGFGRRPDGSGPAIAGDELIDSLRGARGFFTPIPDVPMAGVTREEAARIATLNESLARDWRRMDPLIVGIKRYALDDKNRERVVIDGELAPLDQSKYGWLLSILGPPTKQMVTPAAGDIVSAQISARGGLLLPSVPPHYLFLGIQDVAPLAGGRPGGLLETLQLIKSTPGYLGGWPKPGFLDILPFNLGGSVPDANGFSRLPFGLWRRQGAGFSVLSFDPDLLARVTPQLRVVDSETEAQIRVHVGDFAEAQSKPWINNLYYGRAVAASAGNVRLMHQLNQQLHVPMADAREVSEKLLDATLICPLGGEFERVEEVGGSQVWQSTAWDGRDLTGPAPADFEAPLLKWFRGADAHLLKLDDRIVAHLELDLERHPAEAKVKLPNFFDFFGSGGQKALKPKDKPKDAAELPPPLPPVAEPPKVELPMIELPGVPPTPAPKAKPGDR